MLVLLQGRELLAAFDFLENICLYHFLLYIDSAPASQPFPFFSFIINRGGVQMMVGKGKKLSAYRAKQFTF